MDELINSGSGVSLIDVWINALRSDKYTQGRQKLRNGNAFCCLGVLCDIISPEGWFYGKHGRVDFHGVRLFESNYPHHLFSKGIPDCFDKLANMNDSGRNFREIANVIEEYKNDGTLGILEERLKPEYLQLWREQRTKLSLAASEQENNCGK